MYSPRLRCRLSARELALARCTSRSLRQATYSGEPTALLLRQKVSSSGALSTMVGWPRSRHPARGGEGSSGGGRGGGELRRFFCPLSLCVIAGFDPPIHRKQGILRRLMDAGV